jgi:hypothetical protein
MNSIVIAVIAAVIAIGCSENQHDPHARMAAVNQDAGPDAGPRQARCPACASCPEPEPPPECPKPDAIDFAVFVRMVRDTPTIEMVQAYLHEAGAWRRVVFTVADDAQSIRQEDLQQTESTAPADYPPGDKLMALVRADPERHGTVSIPESSMQHWQYGRTVMGGVCADFGRHKVYLFTGFRLLE